MSRYRLPRAGLLALRLVMLAPLAALATSSSIAWAEAPAAREIALSLDGVSWALDPEAVRAAISREIGAPVTLSSAPPAGKASLVLRGEGGHRVTLTYRSPEGGGKQIERTIELPDDPDRAAETIALLAVNLTRDEAAELAGLFAKKPSLEEISPVEDNAAPNPEPPAPSAEETVEPAPPPEENKPEKAEEKTDEPPAPPRKKTISLAPKEPPPLPRFCSSATATSVFAGADFVPRVGTSLTDGTNTVRHISGNFLLGYNAGLAGIEVGVGLNIERDFACGVQLSAGGNIVTGEVRGAQLAGGLNYGHVVYGAQLGAIDISAGPLFGIQAGAIDIAASVKGAQLGSLNIAGDVTGLQIGALNIAAGNVKGAQIGVINYADSSSFSFGLLNIIRHGRLHFDVWGQETGLFMAGVEHGSKYFHNIYGVGARAFGDTTRLAFTLGVGGHVRLSDRLALDLDVLGYSMHDTSNFQPTALLGQARALLALEIVAHLGVFAGPSYSVVSARSAEEARMAPYDTSSLAGQTDTTLLGWPGVTAGLRTF